MSDQVYRLRPIRGVKARLVSALRRASAPLSTAELAARASEPSGRVAARLIELADEGLVERVNLTGGRGSISRWIAAKQEDAL